MPTLPPATDRLATDSLAEAQTRFRSVAQEITAVYAARKSSDAQQVTPAQLTTAMEQFFGVALKLDREEGETGPILSDDVTQLGDYGLNLLLDLIAWAGQLGLRPLMAELQKISIAVADWIVRHQGEIRTLDPVVDGLAALANSLSETATLEKMADFMSGVLQAAAPAIRQDVDNVNPGRPWRLLNINRAIVATRSHNPALMERVFDELIKALPDDVSDFFAQGMQQMAALNYPPAVRAVMARYHAALTEHKLH